MVLTVLVQTGLAIWWAATMSARVDVLEKISNSRAPFMERIVRVEVLSEQNKITLERIEAKLDKRLPTSGFYK